MAENYGGDFGGQDMSNHVKGMISCRPPESETEKSNESQTDLINRIECAIRHIQTAVDVDPWAVEIAVEAMEKQMQKKPYTNVIHYPYTSDLTTVQCPNCKRRLRTRRTQAKGDRFCPDCGQAIDWEDE